MVTICLATYNSETYLREQLNSLLSQSFKKLNIIAIDDNSMDSTLEILQEYRISVIKNKHNIGVKQSFSKLLEYALKTTPSNYFMFCDHDDVWHSDKVALEYNVMLQNEKLYPNSSLLIHTDLEVVDENLDIIHPSYMKYQKLDANKTQVNRLLVQSIATGCTIMINRELATLALPIPNDAIMHDWWLSLVASEFGKIIFIDKATLKYRQHTANSIGSNGFNYKYIFKQFINNNQTKQYSSQAKKFSNVFKKRLSENSLLLAHQLSTISEKSFFQRRIILLKYRFFKHGIIRTFGLMIKI